MTPINGTFNEVVGGTATSLTATADDQISASFPIGFNFEYAGTTYTSLRASSNGLLTFNATGNTGATNNLNTATGSYRPGLAPLWDDLQCASGVTYQLSGTAPNQVLTVQWLNMEWNFGANASVISFQVKLYETTNVIDFVYRSEAAAGNPTGNDGASIGLMGTLASDFLSLQNSTAAPTVSTTVSNNAISTKPATGQIYRFVNPPATPSTPFEVAGTPGCATGTNLDVSGTPGTDILWYWQSTAAGTSTAIPYSGPYTVFNNTTYYLRAYNTVTLAWSTNSSSFTVTTIPVATSPLAPIAASNPVCVTTGTTLSLNSPILGYEYFWQGTTVNGVSTANNATTPLPVTTTGTYTVSAYDPATQCWSPTTGTLVTVETYIPAAPVATVNNFNICSGATTLELSATPPPGGAPGSVGNTSGTVSIAIPDNNPTGIQSSLIVSGMPLGAAISSISVTLNATHTWNSDLFIYLMGANGTEIELSTANGSTGDNYINTVFSSLATNSITTAVAPMTGTWLPEGVFSSLFSQGNGTWVLRITDGGSGDFGTLTDWSISINYTQNPASTIAWYDAAATGNNVGAGSPFESIGTSVLTNPASFGTYEFFAGSVSGACQSAARTLVTVNVVDVNAVLTPVNASCNGNNNGTFTLGAIECGVEPFSYSVNGGAFGGIPTNLTAGTYSVVIEDDNGLQSAPITVVITQPAAPANLTLVDANYFTADISWTTTGTELSWTVVYGPAGFDPLTEGETITAFTNFTTLIDLLPDTDYEFYVTADCGANPETSGPSAFSTNAGFLAYDNTCGPGFIDISATGTLADFSADLPSEFFADDAEAGLTLPYPVSFNGATYTTMTIGANGGIILGTATGEVGYNMVAAAPGTAGIYPFVEDLALATDGIYTQVLGTAPNRQFVVMWSDVPPYGATDGFTFEVLFEEATNDIYFLYDDVNNTDGFGEDFGADAEIGVRSSTNIDISLNNTAFLTNNSCVRIYNALCPNAVISTVTPLAEEVTLDWNAGLYGETEWTLIYGLAGFDPLTGGSTITVTTSDANIPGLNQLTEYDVYIYSECSLDNLTSGGLLVSFTTLPWCANPTTIGGTTEVDSLFATWNFVPALGAPQPLSSFNLQYGPFGFDLYAGTTEVAAGLGYADTVANAAWLAGGVYQIYVQAVCGTDTSNYSGPYTFVMPLTNDTVCGAEMLQVDGTVYTFNNTGATASVGEGALITGSAPAGYNPTILPMMTWGSAAIQGSNWYTFVAPASGSIWFSGQDENFFASQIAIYEVGDCDDFTTFDLVAASDQLNDFGTEDEFDDIKVAPHFTICGLTPGNTYYVLHDAWNNTFGGAPIFGQYSIKMTEIVLQAGAFADVINTCTGSTVNLFDGIAGYDNGGVWTAEIPAAGTGITDSLWNSTGLAYQLFDFEYRITEGCAFDSIVAQVDVYEPSSAGDDGTISVCRNEPYDLLSGLNGTADLGGTWYNPSNQPLASSAVVSSNIPGQYNFVYIAGNGVCPDDSALVLVNVDATCNYLNVDEMFFATMTVMPNPSNGVFNVANTGSTEVFNFEVTDMEGRIVLAKDAAINGSTTTEINLTGKVTGMYMIRVYNDNAEKTFRVILQ
jgi:subtilisin-like proprotein convertase family protein